MSSVGSPLRDPPDLGPCEVPHEQENILWTWAQGLGSRVPVTGTEKDDPGCTNSKTCGGEV